MKKSQLDRDIVTILVATLITAAVWVGMEVYHAYATHPTPDVLQKYLQPFDPHLDTKVLDNLQQRLP